MPETLLANLQRRAQAVHEGAVGVPERTRRSRVKGRKDEQIDRKPRNRASEGNGSIPQAGCAGRRRSGYIEAQDEARLESEEESPNV